MLTFKNFLHFSCVFVVLGQSASYAMDSLPEQEWSHNRLTQGQLNDLDTKISENRRIHLNKTFFSGEVMVNLMSPLFFKTKIVQNTFGILETQYTVQDGFNCTLRQESDGIIPLISSTTKQRPKRLDGKFAKETLDGSFNLGRFYFGDFHPYPNSPNLLIVKSAELRREVKTDIKIMETQRRPKKLRDKKFSSKIKVEKKPEQDDLLRIAHAQKKKRLDQLAQLIIQNEVLRTDVLTREEQIKKVNALKFGLSLLKENIDNAQKFDFFLTDLQKKYTEINKEIDEELRILYAQKPSFSALSLQSSPGEAPEQKEIKQQAELQLAAQKKKEASRQERPNANPLIVADQEEDSLEEDEGKVAAYVFRSTPKHSIIEALQMTSKEDSSYEGVSISREQLQNFVVFLKQAEKDDRVNNTTLIADTTDLDYYYDSSAGKGSHAKFKLGRGTKPGILSQQGRILTTPQMRNLKAILVQKGLIKFKD